MVVPLTKHIIMFEGRSTVVVPLTKHSASDAAPTLRAKTSTGSRQWAAMQANRVRSAADQSAVALERQG